ncbi:MAG: DUF2497 domain-containing protein [Enhydrobacter sp.]|nr:DUF2497 domain-containing protein [Enhydrobacter sp.]
MSDTKGPGNDPSMDDILASIRKIISDDEARGQAGAAASKAPQAGTTPAPTGLPDDVLLLTDLVDEPATGPSQRPALAPEAPKTDTGGAASSAARSTAPASSSVIPLSAPMPPGQSAAAASISVSTSASSAESPVKQPTADKSLVEPSAAGVAASAFERLNQAVQESVPQPKASDPGPSLGPGGRNLEDIVKELLRPMLKEWLDKNLPTVVERFVEREIVRLTRR